jgi:iron complex outermembrane receptor protein
MVIASVGSVLTTLLLLAGPPCTGRVHDAVHGTPLPGVEVRVEGASAARVRTDGDGCFCIDAEAPARLLLTRTGYDTLRVEMQDGAVLHLQMTPSPLALDGVEVRAVRGDAGTPITQSAAGRAAIQATYAGQEVPAVLERVSPSITTYSDAGVASGYTYFRLRGVDQTRINVTLDGVPLNEPEDQGVYFSNFPDFGNSIGSVQVQRGVGTSSNGAASFAGGVHFETASLATAPAKREVQLGVGSYGTGRVSVQGNTGLLPSGFAFYGRASGQTTDGYREHSGNTSASAFASGGYFGGRDMVKATAFYGRARNDMAYVPSSAEEIRQDPRHNPLSTDEVDDFRQRFLALTYARVLAPGTTLTTTGYHIGLAGDYDVAIDGLWNFNLASHWEGVSSALRYERRKTRLDVGLHANTYARRHWLLIRPDRETEIYSNTGRRAEQSAFVKVSRSLGALVLLGDAQLRHSTFRYEPSATSGIEEQEASWTFFNPKVGASLQATPALQLYASLGQSQREPTRNDILAGFDDLDTTNVAFVGSFDRVRPERVRDLEMGGRYQTERLFVAGNVFWMQFSDEIAPIGELSYIGLPLRKNVDSSYRRGVEVEASWAATSRLKLGANATLMDAEIERYTDDWAGATYRSVAPLLTPRIQSNQTAEMSLSRAVSLRLDGRYVGGSYLDNTENSAFVVPAFYGLNAQVSLRRGPAELRLQVNNLANEQIFTGGQTDGDTSFYFLQAPRHLMLSARVRF